ncbi:PREDICTED: uncharacterized protein CFAP54 [Chaetura pelagica]|uniref:uncharacterized protein CFAP54 n=1 Tax=Chaetura pelagica TaxID=8897 RepID=UPI000523A3D1|nr:PREDICTED: uncharacterized protein CFAP54 [Chaetura pelagica]
MVPAAATLHGDAPSASPGQNGASEREKGSFTCWREVRGPAARTPPAVPGPSLAPRRRQRDPFLHGIIQLFRANTLFNIWIKYKPRLPEWYFNEKLLKVGDFLAQIKEYKLALLQCYGRYFQQFVSGNLDDIIDDVHQFKSTFFPNGLRDKNAVLTLRALQERNVCIYQMICSSDRNLQNRESLQTCLNVLSSLRLTMQVALPQENLCWLIYNGTIHIYTICRHLMMIGQSAKTFARRGLIKIDELKKLENINLLENSEAKNIFTEATLKMSVMIFKRAVYESRRKPKGYFRPKIRVNLKEAQKFPWPRTITEELLTEMFESDAAQFLAILEALSDSSRHVLGPAPPPPDEVEICDVISELFFAGLEILTGGVNSTDIQRSHLINHFGITNTSSTLLDLILTGERGVSGDAAVKFIKLAFSYEEWNVFDSAVEFVVNFLQTQEDPIWKKAEMELELLTLMQALLFPRKNKHSFTSTDSTTKEARNSQVSQKSQTFRKTLNVEHGEPSQDIMILASTVFSCVSTAKQNIQPDKEILVEVIKFLWQKCKTRLQQIQLSGSDCLKYIHRQKAYQWVHILWIINETIQRSSIAGTDIVMHAEVTLHLAAILENVAASASKPKKKAGRMSASLLQDEASDIPEILMKSPTELLRVAYESLEKAINEMNTFCLMTLVPDGKSIFDNCCTKVESNDQDLNSVWGVGNDKTGTGFIMDLHVELIQAQHRISVKLLKMTQDAQKDERSLQSSKAHVKNIEDTPYLTEAGIMRKIKKNKLSRAIFLMQKAVQKFSKELTTSSQRQLLEEALTLIEQVEAEQRALYHSLKEVMSSKKKSKTPPPPLLLSRSHCSMTFKPAPFSSDVQVSWYSIFGCVAEGNNKKVRLNNNKLPNAGEEIPADDKSLLEIHGLDPNEKYIFAVAAYSSDGKLIGDSIGETTKPILAYPPLSATTVRAYLVQVAYQTGNYTLAREVFSPMWDYFVSNSSSLPANAAVISASNNLTVSVNRLRFEVLPQTSRITLHLFLRNIFAICDINVMERELFCDSICSSEILYKEQVARLAECERLMVAIELSNWLNNARYTLQSVVQCYGLLAPIIYHKISSVQVVQILIKCLAVLQEIPSATLQRRQAGCYESIQHMIACTSFYTAKAASAKTSHLAAMQKATENLSVLEANLLKLTKPVMKFRNNSRFLEFFVQVLHKILNEENFQCVLDWAGNVEDYLKRRNDQLLCIDGALPERKDRHTTGAAGVQKNTKTSPLKKEASALKKTGKEASRSVPKKGTLRQYLMKNPDAQSYKILDPEIFSLNNSGTVVVREDVESNMRTTPPLLKTSEMTKKQIGTGKSEHSIKPRGTDTPETKRKKKTEISVSHSPKERNQVPSSSALLERFTKIFLHLRRALIVDPEGDFCIPSCLGGIMDENGGSNLHPQSPLDDVNVLDLKCICNLILKTIELLYQMEKWEALVHIAVQFNIFTHERYTEQVSPLLVYAQRQLLKRIQQFSGPESHESHFVKSVSDSAHKPLEKFDSSKSLLTVTNLQVLEDIFNLSLSLTMVPMCNQQIMNKLTLAKTHSIICLSATINNIPEKVEKHIYTVENPPPKEPSRLRASKAKGAAGKNSRQKEKSVTMVQLIDCKDELNMAMLKGILLAEAEESLSRLVQNTQDKYDGKISRCSAEDLKALIEAKLQLAAISQQRHQAACSVALAFSAIRLLQDAKIFRMEMTHFQEEKDESMSENLDPNVEDVELPLDVAAAQDHVNAHLWLRCRTTLVTALVTQILGVADMEGNNVAERRSVIDEVILEAEAFGDTETQAEMMVQAAILDLQEKRPVATIKLLLQKIISLLQEDTVISPPASLTLVRSMVLLADMLTLQSGEDTEHCSSTVEPLNLLILAHELTIKAIFVCGEPIEQQIEDSTLTCLVLPPKNIFLPHLNLLAQVKMRIGHTLAEKTACTPAREDPLQWLHALKHLESALKLCRASATKKLDMEAELLFQIGKVECQITQAGNNKSSPAAETLLEAIQLSQQHDQNFELIRRSYLEIALLYLHFATNNEAVSQTDKMVSSKSKTSSGKLSTSEEALKSEGYKGQAWIAVRAATQVSEAVLASQLLIGMKSVKEQSMNDAVQQNIPEFASMDLLASFRDFLSAAPNSGPRSFSARDGHLSSVFDSGIVLHIAEMHSFLKKHLLEYSMCCLENFPEELHYAELPLGSPASSSKMSLEMTEISSRMPHVRTVSPVPVVTEAEGQTERRAANASNKEINIQWYIPSLAKPSNSTETKVLLIYAYNTKPIKMSNIKIFSSMSVFSGFLWIPLARVISLQEKLSNLKQEVEMMLSSKSLSSASEPTSFLEESETLKIIPSKNPEVTVAKVHLDEKTEEMAKSCLSEVKALLSGVPALSLPLTQLPFDVTLQSIESLEEMFDPATGSLNEPRAENRIYCEDVELLERVQRRPTKMIRGLEHLSCGDRRRVGAVQPGEEKAPGGLHSGLPVPEGAAGKLGRGFIPGPVVRGQGPVQDLVQRILRRLLWDGGMNAGVSPLGPNFSRSV